MCARTCDSKNLNMSPLCNLQSGLEPSLWQGEVVNTYEAAAAGNNESIPQYVKVMFAHSKQKLFLTHKSSSYISGYTSNWVTEKNSTG